MDTELKLLQSILENRKNKVLTNYINLECQNEQFDILIQKLHEITENRTFDHVNNMEKISIINEINKLVEEQKIIKSKITKLKNDIKYPPQNIMN
ncbi:MAG: hypothetical protein WC197_06895 [Candidatus Gastranaerophilaceae bacterium]